MKFFWWCGAGILSIGIPMAVWYHPTDLWGAVAGGSAGGAFFLLALVFFSLKTIPSVPERYLIAGMAVVFVTVYGLYTAHFHRMTTYQYETLQLIRTYIGEGILLTDKTYDVLIPVLQKHHQRPDGGRVPITESFLSMYGKQIAAGTFNQYKNADPYMNNFDAATFVTLEGDSLVRLTVVDTLARGRMPQFVNATGHLGKLEYRAALSAKGVTYERIN